MMAYFSNGIEGDTYEAHYCQRCIHYAEGLCPVLMLHGLWNYDAVGKGADPNKALVLNVLIPRKGIENLQCTMFIPKIAVNAAGLDIESAKSKNLADLNAWNKGEPIKASP